MNIKRETLNNLKINLTTGSENVLQTERRFYKTVNIIITVLALAFLVYRGMLSVELTDEVYGIAEIYNASFGKKPFIDIWDPHTGWFLYVPFLRLFQLFSPHLTGVVLYFRFVYLLLALLVSYAAYKLCGYEKGLFLPFFASVGYICFSVPQMGYNAGLTYLLILAFCLLFGKNAENRIYQFFGGFVTGIGCLLYPTASILALLMVIPLFFMAEKGKRISAAVTYSGGVALVCAVFFGWILFGKNDMQDLVTGIKATISTPHAANKGAIDADFLRKTFVDRLIVFYTPARVLLWLAHALFAVIISFIIRKKNYMTEALLVETGIFIVIASVQIFSDPSVMPISRGGYISYNVFCGLILFSILTWKKTENRVKISLCVLIGWILIYCFTSDNKNVFYGFDAAGALVFFCACYYVISVKGNRRTADEEKRHLSLSYIVFPSVLLGIGIACFYGYVYRDAPVKELKTRVNEGIYAGLFTTEDNRLYVEKLERVIEENVDENDFLFVANNMPSVYIMSKAEPFTPQTWDAQFLNRGYASAEPVLSYFSFKGKDPDVIVASDYLYPDLFIRQDIELWSYIDEKYVLVEESSSVKIWKSK